MKYHREEKRREEKRMWFVLSYQLTVVRMLNQKYVVLGLVLYNILL